MPANVECSSQIQVDPAVERLQASHIRTWAAGIPDDAHIVAIVRVLGTQREPERVTVGMRATWTEAR